MYSYTALKKYPLTPTELSKLQQLNKQFPPVRVPSIVNDVAALRYRAGDTQLAEMLLRYNVNLIFDIILRFDRTGNDFDDLFQGAFLGMLNAARRYDGHVRFTTLLPWYIFQGVQTECRRGRQTARLLEPRTPRHQQFLLSRIDTVYLSPVTPLEQLLEGLPASQKLPLVLWLEGWSFREISETQNVSYQAIAGRVQRAIITLRRQLEV